MKIGLITTLGTNIGDDFIREGICAILEEHFKGRALEFHPVNKHRPLSVYPAWHPIHAAAIAERLPRGGALIGNAIERVASGLRMSDFDKCGLIVQCGAPVFWPNCHENEWAVPLWRHVVGRLSAKIPVLNLAAGSCYPWEKQPRGVESAADARYLREILGYCALTTVRDTLSEEITASLGVKTPLIPCSAFLVARGYRRPEVSSRFVVINYMAGGGHYDWDQGVDSEAWLGTVRSLIERIERRHKVVLLCHDEREVSEAKRDFPSVARILPRSSREYFEVLSGTVAGVCNRMHASVGLAGMGIPSIAVGTDTRLLMVRALGLPSRYVKEVEVESLESGLEGLISRGREERERLLALSDEVWNSYKRGVANVL